MIIFTALSVGELGKKSIKAWPSSKDCIRSSEVEPTCTKKGKNILSRSESKIQLKDFPLWKLTNLLN